MRVSFDQLRALVWIARLGSFQAAAKKLSLSQPAVSHRLKELEEALGTQLFERGGRHTGVRLTTEGTAALSYAERLLQLNAEMVDRLQSHDPLRGTLRLGAPDSFALICLGELLQLLQTEYPALKVEVTVSNSTVLNALVIDRKLDICFLSEPDVASDITLHFLGTIENAWFAPKAFNFDTTKALRPRDLLDKPIFTNPPSSRLQVTIEHWFASDDLQVPFVNTCDNLSVIRQLVKLGAGIAVLPAPIVEDDVRDGSIVKLKVSPSVERHRIYAAYAQASAGYGTNAVIRVAEAIIRKQRFLKKSTRSKKDD